MSIEDIESRIDATYAEMHRLMTLNLYGDRIVEAPMRSRWHRFWDRIAIYRDRIPDAWLVLTGRAYIG